MFCTRCGRELQSADSFCSGCGTPTIPKKRLCRLLSEKKIAGVCAGVARYLDVDVTLVRLVWVLLTLVHGFGILAYVVAWIVTPTDAKLAQRQQFA
jgi:phage shock protein C